MITPQHFFCLPTPSLNQGLLFIYKQACEMVSHQQVQLRDNWTQTNKPVQQSFIICYTFSAKPKTATMAKLSTSCTSTSVFLLLSLAVCVMLATSVPTVHGQQANPAQMLHYGLSNTVS